MDTFREVCRKHNLKVTTQRRAVYAALFSLKDHPTADRIYNEVRKRFPDISFDTVNRTLLTFYNIGVVDIVERHGGPRRFDADMRTHHHFHCVHCDGIFDFFSEELDNIKAPEEIEKRFIIQRKRVVFSGICEKCREQIETEKP